MSVSRSVLLIDFDNFVSGLMDLDPSAARECAQDPGRWVATLAERYTVEGPRHWLVRRVYLNPGGFVVDPRDRERLYFSRVRLFYTNAGFEVIDCPSLTKGMKNGADIRMALDVVDLLAGPVEYGEFILASSDADFTPVLHRIRAHGRRVTVLTTGQSAVAFRAVADTVIDGPAVVDLIRPLAEPSGPLDADSDKAAHHPAAPVGPAHPSWEAFGTYVRARYEQATEPLNIATLALETRRAVGDENVGPWFGLGKFLPSLQALNLPRAKFSQHHLWDEQRHQAPAAAEHIVDLPPIVAQVATVTELPRLDRDSWRELFEVLEEYARTHDFDLTDSTMWSRDTLADRGYHVGRQAIGIVVRGTQFGGAPLNRTPAPDGGEIAIAFTRNVLRRAVQSGLDLNDDELETVCDWLGVAVQDAQPDNGE